MFTIAKKSHALNSAGLTAKLFKMLTTLVGIAILNILLLGNAFALPSDSQQPITIKSDHAIRDEKTGLTIYEGNVTISQGTLKINADDITLYNDERGLYKIIARGKPAQYHQQPEADKAIIKAEGEVIEYLADEQILHLITGASLNQDGTLMQGDRINYDIAKQLVTASGLLINELNGANSDSTTPEIKNTQIKIVIPPNTIAAPSNIVTPETESKQVNSTNPSPEEIGK